MSESKRPQSKYKTTNWKTYNAALKARGSLTVWLDRDMPAPLASVVASRFSLMRPSSFA